MENTKFWKERFEVISVEKQNQILDAAIVEFAQNGFNGTSINKVAKKARISIGAMYSYFESKEDLFLTVVERMLKVLEGVLNDIDTSKDIFVVVEELFAKAHDYAVSFPELNQIYLDFSTQSLAALSHKVSGRLETITRNLYIEVIEKAKKEQTISDDIDSRILSFVLDNMIMMYQFAFTSDYYRERMLIFLGHPLAEQPEKQIKEIMKFIKNSVK